LKNRARYNFRCPQSIIESSILFVAILCCKQVSKVSDTTAVQARRGKDIQGIPWDEMQFTREKYRETRLREYKNYENLRQSHDELEKVYMHNTHYWALQRLFVAILLKLCSMQLVFW
jgi:hypothetical protein